MVFEHIEKLKQDYTDKYVVVDGRRPELGRFGGLTGQVKTVNMSGRALVEFDGYDNIGWYDIEIDYLQVVDKPQPKEPAAKKTAVPAKKLPAAQADKESSALEKARASDGKQSAGKMSIADVLAAARGGAAEGKTQPPAEKAKPKPKPVPAAPQKTDPSKMSVEDVLAAARGKADGPQQADSADAAADESSPEQDVVAILEAARRPIASGQAEVTVQEEAVTAAEKEPEPAKPPAAGGKMPTDTAGMVAWCREHDGA